jgi:uncharacterized protein YcbK (DUF882 family)
MTKKEINKANTRKINDVWVSAYFTLKEFQSPDTKTVKIDPKVLRCLDELQRNTDTRIFILSGYRTPEHNEAVGGAKKSYHMKGMAVDCYQLGHTTREDMIALAKRGLKAGFSTAIVYKGHVHFDVRYKGLGLRYHKK